MLAADKDVQAAARRWKRDIENILSDVEVAVKADTAKAQKDIEKAAEDQLVLFDVRVDKAAVEGAKKELEEAAQDKTVTVKPETDKPAGAKAEAELNVVARDRKVKIKPDVDGAAAAKAKRRVQGVTAGVQVPFRAEIPVPVAIGALSVLPNIVPALGSMVEAVGQLSGAFALLPAVIGATGLAFGSLKIATLGFGDAIKEVGDPVKFAEAIKQLSPAAQQAATAIQGLMPQVTQLRMTVQDALFTGMGESLTQLGTTYLPIFRDVMGTMAASAGRAFQGVGAMLQTPEMQADIKTFGANASSAFALLLTAAQPLVKAFTDIATVGSSFLPQLATTVGELANRFAAFIGEARESGKLGEWIQNGITAFTQLKDIAVNVWNIFKGIFEAAGGGDFLLTVQNLTTEWSNWVNSVGGQNALRDFFDDAKRSLDEWWPVIRDLGVALFNAFKGAEDVIRVILPLLADISRFLREHETLAWAIGAAFASWKIATILGDLAKFSAALLGLQATATAAGTAAGTGLRASFMAALTAGGALTLPIMLTVAGGALAIWAGTKLMEEGKTIALPVDTGGTPVVAGDQPGQIPVLSGDRGVTERSPDMRRENRTALPGPRTGPAYNPNPAPGPLFSDRNSPPRLSPNLIPADQLPPPAPPPVQTYQPPAPASPGGGGGGSGAPGAPELVAPPGQSFTYSGFGELNWEALAQAESGGNWEANTGNGYYGGLQFDKGTWEAHGGPPGTTADQFSKSDQIKVATALYNERGAAPWPANGWLLTATPDQLNQAGLTGSGRRSSSAGTSGRNDYYGNRGGPGSGPGGRGSGGGGGGGGMARALQQFALSVEGEPYGWGGEGFGSKLQSGAAASSTAGLYDCSGFMSDLYAIVTGQPYQGDERYFTTEANFESLGFKRGYKAGAFNIGVNTSSAGAYGPGAHTAGQLPTGENVEATGGGVKVGPEAKDPRTFANQYHIDVAGGGYPGDYGYNGPGTNENDPMYTTSKDSGGEQLGKDIVSGVMEVFGFGDLFKDPTQFGLFKIFKSIMGLQPGRDNGADNGSGGGGDWFGSGGGGNGLLDFATSLVPGAGGRSIADDMAQWMPGSGGGGGGGITDFMSQFIPGGSQPNVDNSQRNITVQGNVDTPTWEAVDNHFISETRNLPRP